MTKSELRHGRIPDFTRGYWEPPLDAQSVLRSETERIASLGVNAIVSITDHDSINAGLEFAASGIPTSMEWTVPFRDAFFHIGVHNLPRGQERELAKRLLEYTFAKGRPNEQKLRSLLDTLGGFEDVLVVLNHPIWDIEMIGQQAHERSLREFLALYRDQLHALEVNGFRSWSENRQVIEIARRINLPIVSGGDRHCCQPNTMINISNVSSFSEFAREIRVERRSRIAVLPEYSVPLPARQLASIKQILGNDANYGESRRNWTDRIFLDGGDGVVKSLTNHWNGREPAWTFVLFATLNLFSHPLMRPMIASTIGDSDIGRDDKTSFESLATDMIGETLNPSSAA